MHSQFALLKQKRFAPFFATQFFGAFNDNFYKNALVVMLTFHATSMTSLPSGLLVNLCAGIFILPFFLFSATAGQLADKFEKSYLTRVVKLCEIGIMALAGIGFYMGQLWLLLLALFLMGVHSTVFGPVKYAILPQALHEEELIGGNALVESGTFIAILLGTLCGGLLIGQGVLLVTFLLLTFAVIGYLSSRAIPATPIAAPDLKIDWNFVRATTHNLRLAKQNLTVFRAILGISWFWFYGALFLSQFPTLAKNILGGNEALVTLLLAIFSIGVGTGSMLCERLSGRMVEIGLVPFGSIGLSLFAFDLWWASSHIAVPHGTTLSSFFTYFDNCRVLLDLFFIGCFGGFFIVPLYALMQSRSAVETRSRIIAGNNILNAAFMVLAAVMAIALLTLGVSVPTLFLITAILNIFVAIYIYSLVPEFLMRFLCWIFVHSVYRLKKYDTHHIPETGAALLVCNHVSMADAIIISAACPRPIRFVMDHQLFKLPLLNKICRDVRVIPIASAKQDKNILKQAYEQIAQALEEGELVCLFPEGRLSADGSMHPFREGVMNIIQRTPVAVVPMALQGMWGSFFSRKHGAAMSALHRMQALKKISLRVGPPIQPTDLAIDSLHNIVSKLRGEYA